VGKTILEVFPALEPDWLETFGRVALTGETAHFEMSAAELGITFDVAAFRPAPNQYACTFSDITERVAAEVEQRRLLDQAERASRAVLSALEDQRQSQEALRESNSLLRVAGGMARFGGWRVNLADGKATWSDEVARIHDEPPGYSPAMTDGINYYAPEWREKITEVFGDCARDGMPYDEEMQIITARGRRVWVRTIGEAVRDAAGAIIEVQGAFQDITESKQAETALQESEEQFRTLANSMPNLAWWANSDGYIIWYNQRWYEYTGTTPEQMEGLGWQGVHDPKVLPQVIERWTVSITNGEVFDMEFPLRGSDGVFRTFLTRVQPVKDSAGKVLRWFGTNTDISELKQTQEAILKINEELEERVRERTAQLEAVNKELETFSYSVSHDLKAPLRGIDGYSQLLEKEYADRLDDEGRLFIRNIRDSAGQMHQLIEDLLHYSRMERRSLQSIRLDLSELVKMVVAERAAEIKQTGAKLQLEVPAIIVHADRDGLAVVLRNLLENALKFSGNACPPTVDIGARRGEGKAILWVRDNGIGFDMKFHDRIFEIFQRLQRSEDYPGTGIGLALVRKAMGRMGGRVWAESSPGGGTTFFLEIPL
jgi:PAS domain S-box-containing protein